MNAPEEDALKKDVKELKRSFFQVRKRNLVIKKYKVQAITKVLSIYSLPSLFTKTNIRKQGQRAISHNYVYVLYIIIIILYINVLLQWVVIYPAPPHIP